MKYIILFISLIIQSDLSANNLIALTNDPCRAADSLSLVDFYQNSNGPNWNTNWDLNQPIDTWYGVTLNSDGCVTELNLSGNNVAGSIPDDLISLSNLMELNLSRNLLSGNIPENIKDLINLTSISLQKNQLTGPIPHEISFLIDLEYLNLGFNELQGDLPAEFSNLNQLVILDIQENMLTGEIPSDFGNLVNLQKLRLGNNQLTGGIPHSFSNLLQIEKLYVGDNNLSGCFDAALSKICQMNPSFAINRGNNFDQEFYNFCLTGIGECDCSHTRLVENNIASDSYNASDKILSTGQVNSSENVLFSAGQSIELLEEFCVSNQAVFEAIISDCN